MVRSLLMLSIVALLDACTPASGSIGDRGRVAQNAPSLFAYPWVWTDERAENVSFATWRGGPLVLTAIYTQCRTRCPLTIAKLREIEEAFRRESRSVQFLLVTLDPATDTPERLRQFKASQGFPDSWHLLAGSAADTEELAELLGIHVINMDAHLIHNSRILLLDAQGLPVRSYGGVMLNDEGPVL